MILINGSEDQLNREKEDRQARFIVDLSEPDKVTFNFYDKNDVRKGFELNIENIRTLQKMLKKYK